MDAAGGGCMRITCSSPRKFMARWFSSRRKVKGKTALAEIGRSDDYVAQIRCSEDCRRGGDPVDSAPESSDSGLRKREVLFSMGVSCCLLHLIAAGREELHKIAELRNEIDKFLEKAKEELERKHREFLHEPPEQSETYACSTTDAVEGPESSTYLLSPQVLATSMSVLHDGSLRHYASKQGEDLEGGMDQLEAELEAELELLQLHLEPVVKRYTHPMQKNLRDAVKDSEASESRWLSSEEMITTKRTEENTRDTYGVCPYELERRLHELLETRQQETIGELETALRNAKRKLQEKEKEVCWWKDTASVFSERIPESSRISFNLKRVSGSAHPLSR